MKRDAPTSTTPASSAAPYVSRYTSTLGTRDSDVDAKAKSSTSNTSTPSSTAMQMNKFRIRATAAATAPSESVVTPSSNAAAKRYTGASTSLSPKTVVSRDASPSGYHRTLRTRDNLKSRDSSPSAASNYNLANRSRDTSPKISGDKFSSYRLNLRSDPSSGAATAAAKSRTTPSPVTGIALSYLTASDATARCISRRKAVKTPTTPKAEAATTTEQADSSSPPLGESAGEPVAMIEVQVVTRATSPNPPSAHQTASSYVRIRRTEVAKTIEKTILRPAKQAPTTDGEMQTDRAEDNGKYLRFSSTRVSPWPYGESKYNASSNGYQSNRTSSRYSNGSGTASTKADSNINDETAKAKDSPPRSVQLARSNSVKMNAANRIDSSKSKSKSPVKHNSNNESLTHLSNSNATTKVMDSSPGGDRRPPPHATGKSTADLNNNHNKTVVSSSTGSFKWTNKDFRKSALNVGPTDRPRKMSATSMVSTASSTTSTTTSEPSSPLLKRSERATSSSSEGGSSSVTKTSSSSSSTTSDDDKVKCMMSTLTLAESKSESVKEQTTLPKLQSLSLGSTIYDDGDVDEERNNEEDVTASTASEPLKSFLSRAFEPVTNLFKSKSQTQTSSSNGVSSNDNSTVDNSSTDRSSSEKTTTNTTGTASSTTSSKIERDINGGEGGNGLRHIDSGDASSWWDNNENDLETDDNTTTEEVTVNSSSRDGLPPTPPRHADPSCQSTTPASSVGVSVQGYRIKRIESGERAWWMDDSQSPSPSPSIVSTAKAVPQQPMYRIRPIESGERAWWLDHDVNESDNASQQCSKVDDSALATECNAVDGLTSLTLSPNKDDDLVIDVDRSKTPDTLATSTTMYSSSCIDTEQQQTLGDRASPEGVEDTTGLPQSAASSLCPPKLFISRHTNIDDMLGGGCRQLSPLMDAAGSLPQLK